MQILVETILEDERWGEHDLDRVAQRAASTTFQTLGLTPECFEVSLMGCSDRRISELNADFRSKSQATNVLSWPSEERGAPLAGGVPVKPVAEPGSPTIELGDIAIAYETCQSEATAAGLKFEDHVTHLLVHGLLHLLGYDHERDEDAALMERLEVETLDKLGINSPYST